MDGFQATRMLREREASLRAGEPMRTPVVAITASATAGHKQMCLDAGMDDWIPKPFDKDKLCHVLNRWLGERNGTGGNGGHQSESSKGTGSSNERRRQVEEQEKLSEIGEMREVSMTESQAREDEDEARKKATVAKRRGGHNTEMREQS